jgi:sugar phosphate isomerase/epimerase
MPARTGDRSPIDVERRIRAVSAAGYRGFGLNHADLVAARDEIGLARLAELLAEQGIVHVELEFLDYWWTSGQQRAESDRVREDLLHAAAFLGADHIKAGVGNLGDAHLPDAFRAAFAELASDAADVGVRIALEATAFSTMPTLDLAAELVTDVGHSRGGLLIDIWHIYRSGMDYRTMAEVVAPEFVFAIELDDGAREPVGSWYEDTFDNRLLCGEGDFDVMSFIEAHTHQDVGRSRGTIGTFQVVGGRVPRVP